MIDQPGAGAARSESEFAREVRTGLNKQGQKGLPSRYFYDEIGSALFDTITLLPEYGLTRADARIVERHAAAIVERAGSPLMIAELGSGSGIKTRWILEAVARHQPVLYYPIDISASALARCRQELGELGAVVPLECSYLEGLREAAARRTPGRRMLLLFLGSTIGNFERAAAEQFLRDVRDNLRPGDALLLGTDLEKPTDRMLLAYDDPTGVTAAFNRNLLARINRELRGNFDLKAFAHEARYNAHERSVEMHLRSMRRQTVSVPDAGVTCELAEGETIWTEACHKFRAKEVREWARRTGYVCDDQWIDTDWPFAESLFIAA
jgi:dimethylhistidine N-methyltransferase